MNILKVLVAFVLISWPLQTMAQDPWTDPPTPPINPTVIVATVGQTVQLVPPAPNGFSGYDEWYMYPYWQNGNSNQEGISGDPFTIKVTVQSYGYYAVENGDQNPYGYFQIVPPRVPAGPTWAHVLAIILLSLVGFWFLSDVRALFKGHRQRMLKFLTFR